LTTAPQRDVAAQIFHVTHPFHPLHGHAFELIAYKSAWGEDRVYFHNPEQALVALPASWTDILAEDPFVAVAAGRALFRAEDLLDLARLVLCLSSGGDVDV
jgi:hypothetical protein